MWVRHLDDPIRADAAQARQRVETRERITTAMDHATRHLPRRIAQLVRNELGFYTGQTWFGMSSEVREVIEELEQMARKAK